MPDGKRYTVENPETKQRVTFDWSGASDPTDQDLEEVFASAKSSDVPTLPPSRVALPPPLNAAPAPAATTHTGGSKLVDLGPAPQMERAAAIADQKSLQYPSVSGKSDERSSLLNPPPDLP